MLNATAWYPDLISFVASSGGVNVMSYDLSDNEASEVRGVRPAAPIAGWRSSLHPRSHSLSPPSQECPEPTICALNQQVNFYLGTYTTAGIPANGGYEVRGGVGGEGRGAIAR